MYVKLNFGPHAGQVVDLAPEAANFFLADGRASRAFTDPEPVPELAPATSAEPSAGVPQAALAKKKRRG